MLGQRLSHYEVREELGRGGMGIVYRAVDTRLGREVALKVLAPGPRDSDEQERRLRQEARAAAHLSHPAICVVYEIDEAEGATFIAMELVRGETLAALLSRGPLEPKRALDLCLEVAEGLGEAHTHGIIHRDLKPRNVMLTPAGRAKIIDFGLAKLLRPPSLLDSGNETPARSDTDPGRILGTGAYMSPEQVRGGEVDARSDIFAFGALLFEVLVGRAAFRRETAVETLHAVLKEPAPALAVDGLGAAGPLLQSILDRCLAKAPGDRYPSVAELRRDVGDARRRLESPAADEPRAPQPAPAATTAAAARPLRVAIVDDEEPARTILREYLSRAEGVEVVAECRNGFEAVKAASEQKPDLLFLDIQMPKLNGFEVLELLGPDACVIFVTAFDEHAIRAFEVNAVDYLLKPVGVERFAAALERARARLQARVPMAVGELLATVQPAAAKRDRLLVRQGPKVHVVPTDKLDWAEAQDDYVNLRSEGKAYLKQMTLSELEAALDPARFVRIHRSYLLNVDRLSRIETEGGEAKAVILADGTRLPLSRSGYARLKTLL